MKAKTLSVYGDVNPRATKARTGYVTVPRQVTRRTDIRLPKIVLDAILGFCWGEDRHCRPSIAELMDACGMPRRTVQRHLDELIDKGLIARRSDPDTPGGAWITYVLCDPKGFELDADTPCQNWRVLAPQTARPRAKSGAAPPYKQPILSFLETTAAAAEPSSSFSPSDEEAQSLEPAASSGPPGSPRTATALADAPIVDPVAIVPPETAEAVASAAKLWPDTPLLARRVAEAFDAWPWPEQRAVVVAHAIEYAGLMKAGEWVYVLRTIQRWHREGYSLDDAGLEVAGKRPRPKPIASTWSGSTSREPPAPVDPEDQRKKAELVKREKWWHDFKAGSEEPAAGPATKQSPQPAGVACSSAGDLTVNMHSRQEKSSEKQAFEGRSNPVKGPDSG